MSLDTGYQVCDTYQGFYPFLVAYEKLRILKYSSFLTALCTGTYREWAEGML